MKEFKTIGYKYSELNEKAKGEVKRWYLQSIDIYGLEADILCRLNEQFPASDLKVQFSLNYCQGDGLNICGLFTLTDFIPHWNVIQEKKDLMTFYIKAGLYYFIFDENSRYCYSCKFVDKTHIPVVVDEFVDLLNLNGVGNVDKDLIEQFYIDLLDYFENLDKELEKYGYEYLYEASEEEIEEVCEMNDYYFTQYGEFIE